MTTVRIRLLWHKQAQFAGYLLAGQLGLARRAGVEIVCEGMDLERSPIDAVVGGECEMAVASPSHVLESDDPRELRLVLAVQQTSPLVYPVRLSDGIDTLGALAGHRVGVWPGREDLELRWMLHRVGLADDAVVRVPVPDTVASFVAGETVSGQMTCYHEYHQLEAVYEPDRLKVFTATELGCSLLKDGLILTHHMARSSPPTVQAVVDAVLQGWTLAFSELGQAIDLCCQLRPDMTRDQHRRQLEDIKALSLTGATLTHGLGYPDSAHVRRVADALEAVERREVDVTGIADPSFWLAAPARYRKTDWR